MSSMHGIYMLAALLVAIALGGAAAVYSEKPTVQKGATLELESGGPSKKSPGTQTLQCGREGNGN